MKKIKLNKLVLPAGTADQIMVNQALQDVKKYVTKHPNMSAFTRHKPHLLMPSIYDLVFDQSIQNAVGEFIGEPFFMWFSVLFLKMKNSKGFVPWHYDEYFWATKSTKGCTVWVALDDVEKDMGPMIFCDQPISDFVHGVEMSRNNILARGNFSTFTPPKDANIYDACLKKGQFSIHATDIWHSSRPNQSNKDRYGIAFRFISRDAEPKKFRFLKRGAVGELSGSKYYYSEARPASGIVLSTSWQHWRSIRLAFLLQVFGDDKRSIRTQITNLLSFIFSKKGYDFLISLGRFATRR